MEMIEHSIELVIHGKAVEDSGDYCDYTIDNQNEAVVAKGVKPAITSEFRPLVKTSVTYIVMGILVNEEGQVLMMQEAKSSCAGQWYLPAGKMEAGEDIEEAARREVLEETGLDFEPTTLLAVDCAGGSWYRFILTGNVVGGVLKTPANADAESLQALWVKDLGELSLRAKDILPFIERAKEYHSRNNHIPWHKPVLPSLRYHSHLLMRLVIIVRKRSNNCVHVLVSEKVHPHIPVCAINPTRSIYSTLKKYMQVIFGSELPPHKPHGLLSMEHSGKPEFEHDGICLTILVSVRAALEDLNLIDGYTWLELSSGVGNSILDRITKNMTVPLNVIH